MRLFLFSFLILVPTTLCAQEKPSPLDVAQEHLQRGRYGEAVDVFEKLPKEHAVPTALGLSRAHEAQGKYDEAEKAITDALKSTEDAKSAPLLARLAELQLLRGRTADAEATVTKALKLQTDNPAARLVLADLYAATGRLKEAADGYRWFIRFYNQVQPEDAETLLIVGKGSAQHARFSGATRTFDFIVNTLCPDVLKSDKHRWEAYHLSGRLLLEKYNRADAIPEFKQALAINPQAADIHAALALDALQEHDLDEAPKHAQRALEINPKHLDACLVLADLRLEDGQPAEAKKAVAPALSVNPHDERALARVAVSDLLTGKLPTDDELASVFQRLASADKLPAEQPHPFLATLVAVAKRNPHPGVFLTHVGTLMEARRKYDFAERCYQQAIVSMPQLSEPKTALGMLYLRIGRNDEARKILDTAFKQDPFHFRVSNMIKVLKVLETYDSVETEHFVLKVDSQQDRIFGRYAAEYLEEVYPGLVKQFGYEPPGKTQFEVYNKAKGLSGHEWFSARMIGLPWIQTVGASTGKIVALSSPTDGQRSFNWARVLKHEFVHVVTLQQTNFNIPHWYTEALAVRNEGYSRPPQWDDLLRERVPKGELFTLDNINQGFIRPKSADDWQFAYCQSLLYSQYLTETFGEKSISGLLEAYRLNLTTRDAIERVTGVDQESFEKGYRKYLEKITAELRGAGEEGDDGKKLADLEKAYLANGDDLANAGRYAHALQKAGKRKTAKEIADKVREKDPKNPHAALVVAALALRAEDGDRALKALEDALDREKPNLELVELLAGLLLKANEADNALELFELGLKQRPRSKDLMKGMAASAAKAGEKEKLRTALKQLVDLDPDEALYARKLSDMAIDDQAWDEALHYARQALYVDVMDPQVHVLLGKAWSGLGKKDKAFEEWTVAVELKPTEADYGVGLARAEADAGRKDAAAKRIAEILKKHPTHAEAKALADELK